MRTTLRTTAWLCLLVSCLLPGAATAGEPKKKAKLPNIVWITSEDHGPHLGCYGDKLAKTPALDALAKKGMIFRRVWSNAPVCAPSRTAIITGIYPTSTGSEHMRSMTSLPEGMFMFPHYLRGLGYYCTNKVKEDYNLEKTKGTWDDSSNKAHWKNRREGQPFFAVFNSTKSHESQIRNYKKPPTTDPAKVRVPAYHPDAPEVRIDWAIYYDNLAKVDADAAEVLRELEEAGLLEDTIVIYFADHGSGMPRNKRTPLNCGLQVPLIVWFPERWRDLAPKDYRPGGTSERLVGFVDLAPTMLSLAGLEAPEWMQGHAFAGKHAKEGPKYIHGFRGRMDERYDMQRSLTDGRYVYLRNYMPHLPAGQHVEYMFQTRTTKVWKELWHKGGLTEAQRAFFDAPRPIEELYDLESDPDEVVNLAEAPKMRKVLEAMREANRKHILAIRDVGFLPEDEIHVRSKDSTPYAMGHDPKKYPLETILKAAEECTDAEAKVDLAALLKHEDSAVRYWAALGVLRRRKDAVVMHADHLVAALADSSPSVRVMAATALQRHESDRFWHQGLKVSVELAAPGKNSAYVRLAALNHLDQAGGGLLRGYRETIESWPTDVPKERYAYGIARLISKIQAELK